MAVDAELKISIRKYKWRAIQVLRGVRNDSK